MESLAANATLAPRPVLIDGLGLRDLTTHRVEGLVLEDAATGRLLRLDSSLVGLGGRSGPEPGENSLDGLHGLKEREGRRSEREADEARKGTLRPRGVLAGKPRRLPSPSLLASRGRSVAASFSSLSRTKEVVRIQYK